MELTNSRKEYCEKIGVVCWEMMINADAMLPNAPPQQNARLTHTLLHKVSLVVGSTVEAADGDYVFGGCGVAFGFARLAATRYV